MAVLYEALARTCGITPRQADELEIWECAALLGAHRDDERDADTPAPRRAPTADRWAHLRARVAHAAGRGPKPEAKPVSVEDLRGLEVGQ